MKDEIHAILESCGADTEPPPHEIYLIMENTQKHFVNLELNSEIAVSTGAVATARKSTPCSLV